MYYNKELLTCLQVAYEQGDKVFLFKINRLYREYLDNLQSMLTPTEPKLLTYNPHINVNDYG